jgi:methylmalonyl-CoA carboxyltransferase large subunit
MSSDLADIAQLMLQVQEQISALNDRLARLETRAAAVLPGREAAPPARAPAPPSITEEEILAVTAAVAAFLGVRPRVRQIRLIASRAWAQQGRVSIQASHRLHS